MTGARDDRLDVRLRRLFAGLDTSPGFGARVALRVAALPVVPRDVLRERVERSRALAARRLRRESLTWGATASAAGAAGLAVVWRNHEIVAAGVEDVVAAATGQGPLANVAVAVFAACLWPVLRRYLPR
jgi:hypothetical protein